MVEDGFGNCDFFFTLGGLAFKSEFLGCLFCLFAVYFKIDFMILLKKASCGVANSASLCAVGLTTAPRALVCVLHLNLFEKYHNQIKMTL